MTKELDLVLKDIQHDSSYSNFVKLKVYLEQHTRYSSDPSDIHVAVEIVKETGKDLSEEDSSLQSEVPTSNALRLLTPKQADFLFNILKKYVGEKGPQKQVQTKQKQKIQDDVRKKEEVGEAMDERAFIALQIFCFLSIYDRNFQIVLDRQPIKSIEQLNLHRYLLDQSIDDDYKKEVAKFVLFLTRHSNRRFQNWKSYIKEKAHTTLESKIQELYSEQGRSSIKASDSTSDIRKQESDKTEESDTIPQYPTSYHDISAEEICQQFKVSPQSGLPQIEVEAREKTFGKNKLPKPKRPSILLMVLRQLGDFMAIIMIITAAVALIMQDIKASVVILLVVIFNVTVGFIEEYKAEQALEAIMILNVYHASVLRNGEVSVIDAENLVPGDIVMLEEGAQVPADIRLLEEIDLFILESILTGESEPVEKDVFKKLEGDVSLGDRRNMAFMSTTVTRGRGKGIVIATGNETEIGKISKNLAITQRRKTPLEAKLTGLGMIFVVVSVLLCFIVVVVGIMRGNDFTEMIKTGVSLAVSVIPDGLVAVTTVTMSLGVQRMARKNAIVRKMPAVETLGSVTTICSDKTGTLTEGKMSLSGIWIPQTKFVRLGLGHGQSIYLNGKEVQKDEIPDSISKIFMVMSLCNNVQIHSQKPSPTRGDDQSMDFSVHMDPISLDETEMIGDPTEIALRSSSIRIGLDRDEWIKKRGMKFENEFAFDSDRKRMSVIYSYNDDDSGAVSGEGNDEEKEEEEQQTKRLLLLKGAAENVLPICSTVQMGDEVFKAKEDAIKYLEKKSIKLSSLGLRVLCFAYRELPDDADVENISQCEQDLCFLGFAGLMDAPRSKVKESIRDCKLAGIKIVMITGDHPLTARAIAESLQVIEPNAPESIVVRGKDVDELVAAGKLDTIQPFPQVFARVSPDHKLQIVKALQRRDEVVAMIGDGVNDAPSLKRADVGVSMGKSGTDIAKQAASIILADDNFVTIVKAVREGRRIFDNIEKFIMYLLSCNLAEVLIMLAAVFIGTPIPFTPIQILYANLVADTPPAFSLGVEEEDEDIMKRKPRDPKSGIFTLRGWIILIYYGFVISSISYVGMVLAINYEAYPLVHARSFTFALLIVIQLAHAFHSRSTTFSIFQKRIFTNLWLVLSVGIAFMLLLAGLYIPGFNSLLELYPLNLWDWMKILFALTLHAILIELVKIMLRIRKDRLRNSTDEKFYSEL